MSEPKKVLIVDDDMNMHDFYAELFAAHAVTYTTSGEDAVELLQKGGGPFDLIYLDLELLGMSGFATYDEIKKILGAKIPPVVVSSSLSDAATRQTAASKGAAGFVPKPINLQVAIAVAHKLLGGGPEPEPPQSVFK